MIRTMVSIGLLLDGNLRQSQLHQGHTAPIDAVTGANHTRIGLLKQEPKAALDTAQERLQRELDQFRHRHRGEGGEPAEAVGGQR